MDDNHIVTHIPWPPKIAVVIGTYGSPAYIRLQLESRKRFWPDAPVLIHDDDSPERDELMRICNEYGALYYSPSKRSENVGDMAAVVKGIDWAHEISCDIVVKISRRFIIIHEWLDAFRTLAYSTQYPTYAGHCAEYLYPCRSECVAFHVDSWRSSESMQRMRTGIKNGENPNGKLTMEQWYHQQAKEILNSSASVQVRSMRGAFRVKSDAIGCQYGLLRASADTSDFQVLFGIIRIIPRTIIILQRAMASMICQLKYFVIFTLLVMIFTHCHISSPLFHFLL
jgi:glycosyltransferase involved in cell wall biosynthesis